MASQGLRLITPNVMGCRNTTYTPWPISSPRWPAPHLTPGAASPRARISTQPFVAGCVFMAIVIPLRGTSLLWGVDHPQQL